MAHPSFNCVAGKMYGRGSTDDKGPVLAWFNIIEAYQKIGQVQTQFFFSSNDTVCLLIKPVTPVQSPHALQAV